MSLLDPEPRRSPRLLIGLAAAVALGGAALAAKHFLLRPFSPLDSVEGDALGRKVAAFLVEGQANLRAGGAPQAQKDRAPAVLDAKARQALGAEVSERLEALLCTTVDVEATPSPPEELANRFEREGVLLNQAITARGLPYFVDPSIIRMRRATTPMVYSYYIERENTLSGGEKSVRSLFVRRLDDLNFKQAAVGYTTPSAAAALVLLDDVESELIEFLLPSVASGEETLLLDLESMDPKSGWQKELRGRAAAVVKAAYSHLDGASPEQVEELGTLFYRRRALVRSWMSALEKQHYRLFIPRRLIPEADYAKEIGSRVPIAQVGEWTRVHDRLTDSSMLRAFDAIVEEEARSVEQHEVEHQLDYEREKIVVPKPVLQMLGLHREEEAFDDKFALYVASEVSAYLAEIARAPGSPSLLVMALSQSAFNRGEQGGAYSYAALVVIDGIAERLHAGGGALVERGRVDREALTKRFIAITDRSDEEIRAAARAAWEDFYDAKLPGVKLEKSTRHPAWRH